MEFFRRASEAPQRLGVLAGAFNPPTRAHLALARAALSLVDEVVFALPRRFPHNTITYRPPRFESRWRLAAAGGGWQQLAPEEAVPLVAQIYR